MDLVCRWLIGRLSLAMEPTNDSLERSVRQARAIAHAAGDSDLYYIFDVIEDELRLAETQTYGTLAACREDFDKALKGHGTPPFSLRDV